MNIDAILTNFTFSEKPSLFNDFSNKTKTENFTFEKQDIPKYINEFWTPKQRQASSLHEIAYRACFKPQLPRFFINLMTKKGDSVYDPFSGRGTTAIEASLLSRNVVANDINPLSKILTKPRFFIPTINEVIDRFKLIKIDYNNKADIDLSMFYHPKTESEIVSLKKYLLDREKTKKSDYIDAWIKMVATNRLTGHSTGFFSVYTLPPNQAISAERQRKINIKRNQIPEYRNVFAIIIRKSQNLLKDIDGQTKQKLQKIGERAKFIIKDARDTKEIKSNSIQLTVTSPPFLDIVQYSQDNWLRCWFNNIDAEKIEKNITMSKNIDEWSSVMQDVFQELFRITKKGGWVAFEVGEIKNKKIKLEEFVVPLGVNVGFKIQGIMINEQIFTKTSNIWGVRNNDKGTNTNRIVIFKKG